MDQLQGTQKPRVNGPPVFVAHGLTKVYGTPDALLYALREIDLEIRQGEFLLLLGPSGSGKSTLLNILGGLDAPTSGTARWRDHELSGATDAELTQYRREHVGFVFQFYNLMPVLTAERNVELPLLLTHLSKSQRRQHAENALKVVGLSHRLKHYPRTLSGGEQQRVGIARAIVSDPTILLCDEPTGDLDRKSGDEILTLLQTLNQEQGKTIIMVTHDPHASIRASRTVHLDKGQLATTAPE